MFVLAVSATIRGRLTSQSSEADSFSRAGHPGDGIASPSALLAGTLEHWLRSLLRVDASSALAAAPILLPIFEYGLEMGNVQQILDA